MRTAAEIRAELALVESQSVSGDVVDGEGGIYLTIAGENFECRRVSVSWQMMQFARAQRAANITIPSGLPEDSPKRKELEEARAAAGMKMMALLLDTCMVLLKPAERARFESFMDETSASEEGLSQGALEKAIGEAIAAAGGEEGKADRTTASQSSASSGTTSEKPRVISFNRATAEDALPEKV